jgi:hypothetical protein
MGRKARRRKAMEKVAETFAQMRASGDLAQQLVVTSADVVRFKLGLPIPPYVEHPDQTRIKWVARPPAGKWTQWVDGEPVQEHGDHVQDYDRGDGIFLDHVTDAPS